MDSLFLIFGFIWFLSLGAIPVAFLIWIILLMKKAPKKRAAGKILLGCIIISVISFVLSFTCYMMSSSSCEHQWDITINKPATCLYEGQQTKTCSLCNKTETRTIQAIGHNWVEDDTGTLVCTRCNVWTIKSVLEENKNPQPTPQRSTTASDVLNNKKELSLSILFVSFVYNITLFVFLGLIIFGIIKLIKVAEEKAKQRREYYENSSYYAVTHIPYQYHRRDVGKYGEYLIYDHLRQRELLGSKFLFNVYVPIENGQTSEIDVLMIDSHGIFVFESKNYGGWIFGDENSKQWCQCFKAGRRHSHKEYFYNPIKQNEGHINVLKYYLGYPAIPIHNIVVFSERCDFQTTMPNNIIYRYETNDTVNTICNRQAPCITSEQIEAIYQRLYPLTQMTAKTKEQHIEQIQSRKF